MPNCISRLEFSEGELLSAIDNLADQEVNLHLENCEYCSHKLRTLKQGLQDISRSVYRSLCPSPMDLTTFHLGNLTGDKATQIQKHLELCRACRQEIAQFNEFMIATSLIEPEKDRQPNAVEILIAQLTNLGNTPALAGVRGSGSVATYVKEIGDLQITVTVNKMDKPAERFRLTGLLLGGEGVKWTTHLWNSEKHLGSNIVRDGEILFENLERGTYTLILDSSEGKSEREIHLQNIQV